MAECILETAEKLVGGLPIDNLAVCLARVGQHDAKEVGLAALAVGANDPRACAEVDLRFITRPTFEAPEWELTHRRHSADEAPDAVVVPGEVVLGDQILVDALRAEPEIALGRDQITPGLALAATTAAEWGSVRGRAGR
jgi:hypothetical protein